MMHLLHTVAAFLLALVGYSTGAVLASARRGARPAGWELPTAAGVAVAAAAFAPDHVGGWAALPSALAAGLGAGLLAVLARRAAGADPHREGSPCGDPAEDAGGSAFRRFMLRVGTYQGQLTMGFLYFGLLTPFALVSRLTSDPLDIDARRATYWRERPGEAPNDPADSLRRQA